jgi:hypothetical protein
VPEQGAETLPEASGILAVQRRKGGYGHSVAALRPSDRIQTGPGSASRWRCVWASGRTARPPGEVPKKNVKIGSLV